MDMLRATLERFGLPCSKHPLLVERRVRDDFWSRRSTQILIFIQSSESRCAIGISAEDQCPPELNKLCRMGDIPPRLTQGVELPRVQRPSSYS
jgi:hypothetical protein